MSFIELSFETEWSFWQFAEKNKIRGIILSARWTLYTNGDYENENYQIVTIDDEIANHSLESSIYAFKEAFNDTIDVYKSKGIALNIISQPPLQKYHPEKSYFKIAKGIADIKSFSIPRSDFQKLESISVETFLSRADEYNFYHIIDNFCDEEYCYFGNSEASFYYDQDHISNEGAKLLEAQIYDIFSSSER